MLNEAKSDDKSTGTNEIDASEKDQEDSFITCEEGNEDSVNLSEKVMNEVEEVPPTNQACRSSKRKGRKANVEKGCDESIDHDFASDTLAEGEAGEGSETRPRKRSKYLSYPYYTDGFLNFIAKDAKIPKKLRESLALEDFDVSKASFVRKSNRRPCKSPFDSSNESDVINMSCHDLLSQLQMAAIDCHYPNKTESFDSVKVFFSMIRKSMFHDESNIELSSMNTVQQMDVPESSVANCKPCSFDISAPKVLALYSPRYLALYSPTILGATKGGKTRKATDPGLSSPTVKSEAKRRSRKQEISVDKPQPEKRNRKIRPKMMSLNDIAMKSAEMAKLNKLESISRVIDLPIDLELSNNEKKYDALVSMNTDTCTVIQGVDGSIMEDGKEVLPSEKKPEPEKRGRKKKSVMAFQTSCGSDVLNQNVEDGKEMLPSGKKLGPDRRGRKKKSVMACQTSCDSDVQNLNQNVVETFSQKDDTPQGKRGRKKRVTEQNAVKNHQNGTSECSYLNTDEAELVSLGNEAEPILMGNETELVSLGNEAEPILMGNETELVSLGNEAEPVLIGNETDSVLMENEVEPVSMGNETVPVLMGKEAEPVSMGNETVLIVNEAEPVLMGKEAEPPVMRSEGKPLSLGHKAQLGLLGSEFEQLSLGKEAKSDSLNFVAESVLPANHLSEAKQGLVKKGRSVSGMHPLSTIKQNLQTMTTMLAKTSDKVPGEMKSKLKEKIESLVVKVNTREGSSSSQLRIVDRTCNKCSGGIDFSPSV